MGFNFIQSMFENSNTTTDSVLNECSSSTLTSNLPKTSSKSLIKQAALCTITLLSYLNPITLLKTLFNFLKNLILKLYKFFISSRNEFRKIELDLESELQAVEFKSKLDLEEIKLKYESKFKQILIKNLSWSDWIRYKAGYISDSTITACVNFGINSILGGSTFSTAKDLVISTFNSLIKTQ